MANKKVVIDITAKDETKKATDSAEKNMTSLGKVATATGLLVAAGFGVAVIRESVELYARQERAINQLESRIKSTGGAAGKTSEELQDMAASLQQVSTFGDEAILEMNSLLLTFTNIAGPQFEQATEAILNVSTVMGQDLQSAALQVGKALNDPILGMTALSRSGIQFTQEQKETIKTLVEMGDTVGAQTIMLKELEIQFGGAAMAARQTFSGAMEAAGNSIGDLQENMGEWIIQSTGFQKVLEDIPMLVDRINRSINGIDAEGRLKELQEEFRKANNDLLGSINLGAGATGAQDRALLRVQELRNEIGLLQSQIDSTSPTTPAEGAAAVTLSPEENNAAELADFEYREALRAAELEDFMMIQQGMEDATMNRLRRERDEEEALQLAKQQLWRDSASIGVDLINALFIFTGSKNKQLFEIGKIAAIAQATINTYQGATKALAQGGIWGGVGAAAVIANGLVQVARIKATTMSGGGGGGGGGGSISTGGGPSTPGEIPQIPQTQDGQGRSVTVNFENIIGDPVYVEDTLIPLINDAVARGVDLNIRA